jgi:arginine/ornithine transport system permease protein
MLHGYLPALLQGAGLSLAVAFGALALALLLGMAGALAKLSRSLLARTVAQAYTTLIRAVPDLVLMLLVFYGGQMAVNHLGEALGWGYVDIDPFVAGVLTHRLHLRCLLHRGAARRLPGRAPGPARGGAGLRLQPLAGAVAHRRAADAAPRAAGAVSNNWLVLIKATAIVSVIGLPT